MISNQYMSVRRHYCRVTLSAPQPLAQTQHTDEPYLVRGKLARYSPAHRRAVTVMPLAVIRVIISASASDSTMMWADSDSATLRLGVRGQTM